MDFNRIINGMMRAIRLDKTFFEEVENDPSYNQDALGVVIIVAAIGSIGSFIGALVTGAGFLAAIGGLIVSLVLAILGYFLWVFVAHWIGTQFFKGVGDRGEVQRALGFAYAPQALNILSFIPCVGGIIAFAAWIWSIVAAFIAIRQSLEQDDANAALTVIISGIAIMIVVGLIGAIFAGLGLGVAALSGALGSIGQ
ncbi:MAG: YIP1 family protein [Anaerolineae bacterium]|jgi:hypothetical protein|nr:YIP1 family protein [Anaerolineae bacterium]